MLWYGKSYQSIRLWFKYKGSNPFFQKKNYNDFILTMLQLILVRIQDWLWLWITLRLCQGKTKLVLSMLCIFQDKMSFYVKCLQTGPIGLQLHQAWKESWMKLSLTPHDTFWPSHSQLDSQWKHQKCINKKSKWLEIFENFLNSKFHITLMPFSGIF